MGFVFYTNAESRKGGEIRANPQAALLFHWKSLRRQIRIEGPLEEVPPAMADAYFHSRASGFAARLGRLGPVAAARPRARPIVERVEALARARYAERDPAPAALDRLPPDAAADRILDRPRAPPA